MPFSKPTRIHVELGPRRYPVIIGTGLLGRAGEIVRNEGLRHRNAFVVTNPEVAQHYFPALEASLRHAGFEAIARHDLPVGEAGKNWDEFTRACAALLEAFPEAGAAPLVVLLGGGVVGDLGGFAAAVFRRGVPFLQIPTTLLAAVDSSVGGKVAVNFGGVKNIMGAFSQPRLVLCDLDTLRTLPPREIRSGLAEVIKYGAVCSDILFRHLESGGLEDVLALDPEETEDVVAQCVGIKARVVEEDEFDKKGIRNVLNFGHTIGHGLELSAGYDLTHGEAISIGMIAATRIACEIGFVDESYLTRLRGLIVRAGLPIHYHGHPELFDAVKRAMQMDKKFRDGRNVFVLPTGIGSWAQRENVSWDLVDAIVRDTLGG
jgi:3-dehydroquinate synthase